jgi:hypothetical protein
MAQNGMDTEKLSQPQQKAIVALLENKKVADAAKKAGVPVRTLYRWMAEDVEFKACLKAAEGDLIDSAVRRLVGIADRSIDVIKEILNDEEVKDAVRLRAATTGIEAMLKMRELRNVEDRLSEIERVLAALVQEE